jgi:hypothetical protein
MRLAKVAMVRSLCNGRLMTISFQFGSIGFNYICMEFGNLVKHQQSYYEDSSSASKSYYEAVGPL